MRLIIALSLMVPLAPSMAGITDSNGGYLNHQKCNKKTQADTLTFNNQQNVHLSTGVEQKKCEKSCCTVGRCACQTTCVNTASSGQSLSLIYRGNSITISGADVIYAQHNSKTFNSLYFSPALRPPII